MVKHRVTLSLLVVLTLGIVMPLAAEEEMELIVVPHLGGSLAVSLEVVETVFFMEKDGMQRLHLVWKGNAEGKTLEGADAADVWKVVRGRWEDEFLWVSHMNGSLGIANDAITSLFFMDEKDGKPATLRINYGGDAKTVEGAEAVALWKSLAH